ncbi:MAG: methyl-accepting chemotaxis protein [Xenococcaceae cyanobacterium MO_188.B32]|nr:methyl-accepting chemotaxis protein [Xenococcaceae cyanobacterium MO_188.B32]
MITPNSELRTPNSHYAVERVQPTAKSKQVGLQTKLLSVVLPTIIGTLVLSSLPGYYLIHKTAKEEVEQQLENKAILAKDTIEQLLDQAIKIPQVVASNPRIVSSIRTSRQKVQNSGLDKLSIPELEQKFAATKLLALDRELNDYLRKVVLVTELREIFYTDSYGLNIAYSNPTSDFVQRDEDWWQKGKSQTQWLSPPKFDASADNVGLELVQAIKDPNSGEFLGVIKALLPENYFDAVANNLLNTGIKNTQIVQIISPELENAIKTITPEGLSPDREIIGGIELARIASLVLQEQKKELAEQLRQEFSVKKLKIKNADSTRQIIVSFVYKKRLYKLLAIKERNWVAVASINYQELQNSGNELTPIIILNLILVSCVVAVIISLLSRQISQPLVNLAATAEQAAAGNLDVRAKSLGTFEVQTLANSLNNLIVRVRELLNQERIEAEKAKNLQRIIQKINEGGEKQGILATVVKEVRQTLPADRVIYYQFDRNWQGTVTAESVLSAYPSALGAEINDPCFARVYIQKYERGRIAAIDNLAQANLTDCYRQQLESCAVKANLVLPVIIQNKLDGLLIVHQCSAPRHWETSEIDWLTQIANQISFALDRLSFLEQLKVTEEREKKAREYLQQRALQLLMEVDPVSRGDLTIRARVQEDEIGTIADSYNATIENLHKIVNQVKAVSQEVQANTSENERVISNLAREAVKQAEEISLSMVQIQKMSESIKAISANAGLAESIVQNANQNIAVGDEAMNRTVAEINAIQTSVNEAAQKVKQLGESSQAISQAVNLIGRFAAQTHLLALKASIEAARAGEQGKGFAVIADEVRSLAARSAEATAEIDNLVTRIQLETNEVVEAMNTGTKQVEVGTQLVRQTRQSLTEVTAASHEISQLVKEIAQAAVAQAETSGLVSETIANVAIIAEANSRSATKVSTSIEELYQTAEKLQVGIGQFKT